MTAEQLSHHARAHLEKVRTHYENGPELTSAALSFRDMLAAYYNLLIPESASVLEIGCGAGDLLSRLKAKNRVGIDLAANQIRLAQQKVPDGSFFVGDKDRLFVLVQQLPEPNLAFYSEADVTNTFGEPREKYPIGPFIVNVYNVGDDRLQSIFLP